MMAPVLPGLTDSAASIEAVAQAAKAHGAAHFHAVPLRLAPHVKEFYLDFIASDYPDLLAKYRRAYPGAHAPREYREKLGERIERIRAGFGFAGRAARRREPSPLPLERKGPQLRLPL